MENNKPKRRTRIGVYAITSVCTVAAAAGVGYAVAAAVANPDPEIKKEHTIDIADIQIQGFTVTCDKEKAKMGDTVHFYVTNNSNDTKVPKAIIIESVPAEGSSEEAARSSYELVWNEDEGRYVATVQILYKCNMKVTLDFDYIKPYTVTFDSDGGTAYEAQKVEKDSYATNPGTPIKEGCHFLYWWYENDDTAFDFHTKITDNITLHAKYETIKCDIIWKNYDGTEITSARCEDVKYGTMPVYSGTEPTKPADAQYRYVFSGWSPKLEPVKPEYIEGSKQQYVYTAQFDAIVQEYSITFETNGGSSVPSKVLKYGQLIEEPETVKEGYTFQFWSTKESGATAADAFDFDNTSVTGDLKLYAYWNINKFTVSFDTDGGSTAPTAITNVEWDTTIPESSKPTDPTKSGYEFQYWMYDGQEFMFGDASTGTRVKGDITLTAKWNEKYYSVTFEENGGTTVADQSIQKDHKATNPKTTKTGYKFLYWSEKQTGATASDAFDFDNTAITKDTTLYAYWEKEEYTVTYNADGGTPTPDAATVKYDETIATAPTQPTKTGYTFGGWWNNGSQFEFGTTKVTSNMTLVAKWTENAHTVTFDVQGGTKVNAQKVLDGYTATNPGTSATTKTGYTFKGWYTTATGDTQFDFANTTITADTTIYAQWTPVAMTVTFMNGTSTYKTDSVDYGTAVTKPTDPTPATGKRFVGWSHDASTYNPYDFSSLVTTNITLHAYYEDITITDITLNSAPTKVTYAKTTTAATLDLAGCSVKIHYSYGDPVDITDFSDTGTWTVSGFDSTALGTQLVKLSHKGGKYVEFNINVIEQYELAITTQPTTVTYAKGATFSPIGLKVTLSDKIASTSTDYEWKESSTPSGFTITGADTSTTGIKTVTVTHTESQATATFPISVTDAYYTVKFYLNDGTTSTHVVETVKDGDKVVKPSDPVRTGYTFQGWYKEAACSTAYDFDTATTAAPGDAYAKWKSDTETGKFNGVSWTTVISAINTFESYSSPTVAQAQTLCTALGVTSPTAGADAKTTLETNLVSKTGTLNINDKDYNVTCIGAMHDVTEDGDTVALTFELSNALCDSDGSPLCAIWDDAEQTATTRSYVNSTLRANLTGGGTGSFGGWFNASAQKVSESRTALDMLSKEIQTAIKTVKKSTIKYESGTYSSTTYTDKLFPLTSTEIKAPDFTTAKYDEGTEYLHYTNGGLQWKTYVGSGYSTYWTGTLYGSWTGQTPASKYKAYTISYSSGAVSNAYDVKTTPRAVAFAFCI